MSLSPSAPGGWAKSCLFAHQRQKDGQNVVVWCIRRRKMHQTTFFHASAWQRWAKQRFPVHPRLADGQKNVFPSIRDRKMRGKTFSHASAKKRYMGKSLGRGFSQGDARNNNILGNSFPAMTKRKAAVIADRRRLWGH
jgi:hypothetical protein